MEGCEQGSGWQGSGWQGHDDPGFDVTGRLVGKVALVTGAGSGIGRASAQAFAAAGASALILVDRDAEAAEETAGLLDCPTSVAPADVTDPEAPADIVARSIAEFGPVTVLMTSAGISVGRSLVDTTPEEWDQVFAVNVKGTFLWMRAVIPGMVEQGSGSVIAVASQLAVSGGRGNAAYIASKGAIVSLARTTAVELAPTGVRVNSILPGATETPLLGRSFARLGDPDQARARSLARHPMGRFGRPEEIAAAALYLASDESSFTTGTELAVDGGWIAG
jgi:2-keto-3-deoxy-L-fuconate dehydrogenase